jgi:Cu+-exporting ATPase
MESVNWKVEGMTCSNCALTISKYLQKQGLSNVKVNPIDGDVSFNGNGTELNPDKIAKGIEELGYKVVSREQATGEPAPRKMNRFLRYTLICTLLPWC